MEAPSILSGLIIANPSFSKKLEGRESCLREIFSNGPILLLVGSFLIAVLTGKKGLEMMGGFLISPFQGFLAFFLLDMGLLVSRQTPHLKEFTPSLLSFGIYMPLIGGILGATVSKILGLDLGTGTLFMVLCGSASYIAAPSAMRLALPEAKAGIYIPLSLGVTFPFNRLIGIPIYLLIAKYLLG